MQTYRKLLEEIIANNESEEDCAQAIKCLAAFNNEKSSPDVETSWISDTTNLPRKQKSVSYSDVESIEVNDDENDAYPKVANGKNNVPSKERTSRGKKPNEEQRTLFDETNEEILMENIDENRGTNPRLAQDFSNKIVWNPQPVPDHLQKYFNNNCDNIQDDNLKDIHTSIQFIKGNINLFHGILTEEEL
ncbi:3353_t:CDS:2 [Ambispora gerdemannii]|uniref:3353_t:CDS:1 n=1 Tax=Ambispora gerdemannii TaxID=144530 RepID=A0A9N8ZYR9_9GLOM|nr:3353_t:CDS:2 [Ambispora gerdemannii]